MKMLVLVALLFVACVFSASVAPRPNFNLAGLWIKHDRAVEEIFHIAINCTACCLPNPFHHAAAPKSCLPQYSGAYVDGPFAGHTTFNVTSVGDLMSAVGEYRNFADSTGTKWCPAPFAMILEDDTNVALIAYGSTFGTVCGDYTGDSARYYRASIENSSH
jgi:hypothetical protein